MSIVVNSISRNVGDDLYRLSGEMVPPADRDGHEPWTARTKDPIHELRSNFYITESLVNWFTDEEWAATKHKIIGVVPSKFKICHEARDRFNKRVKRCKLTTDVKATNSFRTNAVAPAPIAPTPTPTIPSPVPPTIPPLPEPPLVADPRPETPIVSIPGDVYNDYPVPPKTSYMVYLIAGIVVIAAFLILRR